MGAHAQGATSDLLYQPSLATNTVPLYATVSGKAWLATLKTEQAIQNVLKNGGFDVADKYGPNAIRSIDALPRELEATTRRGFGLAMNEAEPGVTALATTIRSENGSGATLGTVSIAGPSLRMTKSHIHELAPLVIQSASELSKLWPLRPRSGRQVPAIDVAEAA